MARRAPSPYAALAAREIALGNGSKLATHAAPAGTLAKTVDRVAGAISPGWLAGRKMARMEMAIATGGYDVTSPSRTRRSGVRGGGPADNAQDDRTLWDLREICRDHDRNNALFSGIVDRWAENVAGPEWGFRPDSDDETFNRDAADALGEMAAAAEYRGLFNLQDVIYTGTRSVCTDGDLFLLPVASGRLQMIEAHDVVQPFNGRGYRGRRVVGGVELDEAGQHAAYYVRDPAAESAYACAYWVESWDKAQRIPADRAIHAANRHRFSQTRGVPLPASALDQFEQYDRYLDAEQLAAILTADIAYAIKRTSKDGGPLPGQTPYTDVTTASNGTAAIKTFEALLKHEPGQIHQLLPDEELELVQPQRPGTTFEPYSRLMLRMFGCGMGMPLELVLLDFSQTNYSSARAALLQAYRAFLRWQRFVRDHIIAPVYGRWMSRWIARGDLAPVANAYKLAWFPPRWAWVDPLKEVLALERKVQMGFCTLEELAAAEGHVMEEIAAVRQKELERFRTARVPTSTAPENLYPNQTKQPGGDEPVIADDAARREAARPEEKR